MERSQADQRAEVESNAAADTPPVIFHTSPLTRRRSCRALGQRQAQARVSLQRQRGRHLLYELSWRLAGSKKFTATGWPGRLFYREI